MPCRLCGYERIGKKYKVCRNDEDLTILKCLKCGFIFREDDKKDASSYYGIGYYKGCSSYSYMDERNDEEACRSVWRKRFLKWKKWDKTGFQNGSFLDVGCSFGGLMNVAAENGYLVSGIDISDYAGDYAKKRFGEGSVSIGNIEDIKLPGDLFSIVSLIEVIEHVVNVRKALKNIYDSMKKGGVIVLQTADMEGLQARLYGSRYHYYLPGHFSYFSRYNLSMLLKETGFREIKFYGGGEFGLLPKLLKSAAGYKNWIDYFRWIKIIMYHFLSMIAIGRFHLTSSMVLAAWK